jgi:hypothetical protein
LLVNKLPIPAPRPGAKNGKAAATKGNAGLISLGTILSNTFAIGFVILKTYPLFIPISFW